VAEAVVAVAAGAEAVVAEEGAVAAVVEAEKAVVVPRSHFPPRPGQA